MSNLLTEGTRMNTSPIRTGRGHAAINQDAHEAKVKTPEAVVGWFHFCLFHNQAQTLCEFPGQIGGVGASKHSSADLTQEPSEH